MKKLRFIVAALALTAMTAFVVVNSVSAEIVSNHNATEVPELTPEELLDMEEAVHSEEISGESVPEPATFGLIAFGLAVGGGLMIRRKD